MHNYGGCPWAWKMAKCLRRSVAVLPPTHFLTLHAGTCGTTDAEFGDAARKFLKALKRRCPGKRLEHLLVNEWCGTVRHAHVLIRTSAPVSKRAMRRIAREARKVAGVRGWISTRGCW